MNNIALIAPVTSVNIPEPIKSNHKFVIMKGLLSNLLDGKMISLDEYTNILADMKRTYRANNI